MYYVHIKENKMSDIFCSYCGSLIINDRCDSCGAPIINACKHITINNLRQAVYNQKKIS